MFQVKSGELLKEGWEIFKGKMLFIWLVLAIIWGVSLFFGLLEERTREDVFGFFVSLASFIATIILQLGFIRVYLDLVDRKDVKIEQLFSEYGRFFPYLGASILYGLGVVIGLILLIVPGIYIALRYSFYSYLIVDKGMGVFESFKKSSEMTKGIKWQLVVFSLAMAGVNILGLLFFVVGLLVTVPLTSLAFVVLYRKLADTVKVETPVTVPESVPPAPVV